MNPQTQQQDDRRPFGPEGFTQGEIRRTLDPYLEDGDPDVHSIIRFSDLPADVLLDLFSGLPEENLRARQNDSPTVLGFMALADQFPRMEFVGYWVRPVRPDERVSVTGLCFPAGAYPTSIVKRAIKRHALAGPDEWHVAGNVRMEPALAEATDRIRAWWD